MKHSDTNTGDDNLARLLRLAGARPEPPPEVTAQVYDNVRAAWLARGRRRSRNGRLLQGAVAASVVVMAAVLLWPASVERAAVATTVGRVDQLTGTVSTRVDGVWQALRAGDSLWTGTPLRTSVDAGVGLQLRNGTSLRVAADTRLVFDTTQRVQLAQGKVYLDTAMARYDRHYEVATAAGVVRNLGTQFEVFSDGERTRVRVRGGEVRLETGADSLPARRGEQLLAGRGGHIEHGRFPSYDPQWQWVQQLAPVFETDDSRVADLVDWVARETGREVVFADASTRNAAAATRISGSIAGPGPEQVLTMALATTRLQAEIGATDIVIKRTTP